MTIAIINGPNLNLLGERNPEIYGSETLQDILDMLRREMPEVSFIHFQSNHEGEIIDRIQAIRKDNSINGIVINPGAYAHYSYAIADALRDIKGRKPVVEVHISNIHAREEFRSHSVTAACVDAVVAGAGTRGYLLGSMHVKHLAEAQTLKS
ncbi:MAG: 3-dehydroquinate dehydratase [Muribaculaceae bacterium]|nr:3-dehydroquinate dehydratase [Muribaculaceae bacterium]